MTLAHASSEHSDLSSSAESLGRARDLAAVAQRHALEFRTTPTCLAKSPATLRQDLASTPLATLAEHASIDQLQTLHYTLEINDRAVDYVLDHETEPLVLAYATALLTQRSIHTFVNPHTLKQTKNLTAAKRAGTFFTPPSVATRMADLALEGKLAPIGVAVEPAAGTGMLSAALLARSANARIAIERLEAWELSPYLAQICQRVLERVCTLLDLATLVEVRAIDAVTAFGELEVHADVVVLNPPYGRVKYLRSEATNAETRAVDESAAVNAGKNWVEDVKARYMSLAEDVGLRPRGLDHQRVFMAASFAALADNGRMVCIAPSAWTSGTQSEDLRRVLLTNRHVSEVIHYPEDTKLFPTVNQPTAIVAADRPGGHDAVRVSAPSSSQSNESSYLISYDEILDEVRGDLAIPLINAEARPAYEQVRQLPTLREQDIKNARGELDLTLDGWMLSSEAEGPRAIRGDHIERYRLDPAEHSSKSGYVSLAGAAKLRERPKWADSQTTRIVGRQVAYMGKKRRLSFALVGPGDFVTNSCNYLVAKDSNERGALLGYLNSAPAEWWFRIHSSNNHVSNGEIDALPWPFASAEIRDAVAAAVEVRGAHGSPNSAFAQRVDAVIDALICLAIGFNNQNARAVLSDVVDSNQAEQTLSLLEWFRRWGVPAHLLNSAKWLQHERNTLSALDLEMIRHIPIGGNWQNIPESVPSERVRQIRAMSKARGIVRTTYYGRLRPDQPAYTIATYYNRPGNGTNIHPVEDRTISHREAARFQSFPDRYGFIGGDGAIRKQIGNAVPPLLAKAVATRVMETTDESGPVVDLFAGAGGLSLGFEEAGFLIAAAAENDAAALRTYAFNHPTESIADPKSSRTLLLDADLSLPDVRDSVYASIRQKLGGRAPAVLVGGPPCQGFSYAGFRDPTDSRSDLATAFLDFVDALRPDAVVMENVEGLLTAQGGRVINDLMKTLRDLGYPVDNPWVLAAEQFGVPQMRRRVFLVASRGESIDPPEGYLDRCFGRREPADALRGISYPVTVEEAISDLPPLGEGSWEQPRLGRTHYAAWVRGENAGG